MASHRREASEKAAKAQRPSAAGVVCAVLIKADSPRRHGVTEALADARRASVSPCLCGSILVKGACESSRHRQRWSRARAGVEARFLAAGYAVVCVAGESGDWASC